MGWISGLVANRKYRSEAEEVPRGNYKKKSLCHRRGGGFLQRGEVPFSAKLHINSHILNMYRNFFGNNLSQEKFEVKIFPNFTLI